MLTLTNEAIAAMNRKFSPAPTRYVLGFMFDRVGVEVLLIRKKKPKWQAGLLNGIGGKIEPHETEWEAMKREFQEETGLETRQGDWRWFCTMSGDGFAVYCFTARSTAILREAKSITEETVEVCIPETISHFDCVSNLHWLIEMARDENYGKPFFATVRYSHPFRLSDV